MSPSTHKYFVQLINQNPFRLLSMDLSSDMGARSSSESSMVSSTFGESNTADFNEDTEYLIRNEQKPTVRYTTRQMLTLYFASVDYQNN